MNAECGEEQYDRGDLARRVAPRRSIADRLGGPLRPHGALRSRESARQLANALAWAACLASATVVLTYGDLLSGAPFDHAWSAEFPCAQGTCASVTTPPLFADVVDISASVRNADVGSQRNAGEAGRRSLVAESVRWVVKDLDGTPAFDLEDWFGDPLFDSVGVTDETAVTLSAGRSPGPWALRGDGALPRRLRIEVGCGELDPTLASAYVVKVAAVLRTYPPKFLLVVACGAPLAALVVWCAKAALAALLRRLLAPRSDERAAAA